MSKLTEPYEKDPRWAKPQLNYLEAKAGYIAAQTLAQEHYENDDTPGKTEEEIALQQVQMDTLYGVNEARDRFCQMRDALIDWSKDMAVKSGQNNHRPQEEIDRMIHLHDVVCRKNIRIRDQLIELALNLNASTIPTDV